MAHAAGRDATPKRVVFFVQGNGLNPPHVQPEGIKRERYGVDKLDDRPLTDHDLPEPLAPLAKYKNRMTIIQGLSGMVALAGHSADYGALGCYRSDHKPRNVTIDGALARALPAVFPHVGLGITEKPDHSLVYNISASAPGKALPTICRPDLAYSSLFGLAAGKADRAKFESRSNVLDFLADDVRQVRGRLAGPERDKLDTYLQAFEGLRDRQVKLASMEGTIRANAPEPGEKLKSDEELDRLDVHVELAAAALIAGLTNVVTLSSGCGDPYFGIRFKSLGIDKDLHSIGHGGSLPGFTSDQLLIKVRKAHMERLARLCDKLAAAKEGGGSVLDNTLIVYLSDFGDAHHPEGKEWPFVLIGNLGGRLKAGNRFLQYPKYGAQGHKTMGNLYTTLLHAAGKPSDATFGDPDLRLKDIDTKGPLAELLPLSGGRS
jgi:hypothetical protein